MKPLEAAIMRTVLYADVFDFPLTIPEIHHFLIHTEPVTPAEIEQVLQASPLLNNTLIADSPYIACRHDLVDERKHREQASQHLWPLALRYGAWLGRLPFVRMVALTGALAMCNAATRDDDLDYLIVTAPNRVWLARAFAILVVRLMKTRGLIICPNYVLADNALTQERQNLFIAHEIAQMIPIYGHPLYWQFRHANHWTSDHLPNAQAPFYTTADHETGGLWQWSKRLLETLLGGQVGDALEGWEYRRKVARFSDSLRSPQSAARIDRNQVKGHFNDYGHPALHHYHQRLRAYGLADEPLAATGD